MPEIDFEARRGWLDRHLDCLRQEGVRVLVAEIGGTPVGFIAIDPTLGHVDQLAVHPRHQGGGVASRLMQAAKALSPGGLWLDVNADNPVARRFYARQGFVAVSSGRNPRSGLPTLRLAWAEAGSRSGAV